METGKILLILLQVLILAVINYWFGYMAGERKAHKKIVDELCAQPSKEFEEELLRIDKEITAVKKLEVLKECILATTEGKMTMNNYEDVKEDGSKEIVVEFFREEKKVLTLKGRRRVKVLEESVAAKPSSIGVGCIGHCNNAIMPSDERQENTHD